MASFPSIYGTKDHQQLIGENIVAYFNGLGERLIAAKEAGVKIEITESINPIYAHNMRQIGLTSTLLDAGFTSGVEHRISKSLSGTDDERYEYHWYFDKVYKTLCEELSGGWDYITYEDTMLNRVAAIKALKNLSTDSNNT
jgi:hypothetical protein